MALNRTNRIPNAAIIVAALLVFALLVFAGPRIWPDFVGAVTKTTTTTIHIKPAEKAEVKEVETIVERQNITLWHIIGNIVIPVAGGLVIWWAGAKFNQKQREREEAVENKQAQDTAIQAYLDQMSDLLVNRHLRSLPKGSDIHRLAEARTLEILLGLDRERKRRPLKLVYGLGLIKNRSNTGERNGAVLDLENLSLNSPETGERDGALLDLENLSLDHADLTELSLRGACLRFADLRGADLQGSDLSGADLSNADLRGANLTNADLSNANLSGANLLPYDEDAPAKLSLHNLKDHALPSADELRFLAELQEKQRSAEQNRVLGLPSRLIRSLKSRLIPTKQVTFTNLTDTKLAGADLTSAILANAYLGNTRGLKREQVERAIGNGETKLPDKEEFKQRPVAWASKGIEKQIKEIEAQVRDEKIEDMEEQIKNLHNE